VFIQARRTTYLNHRPETQPYALDLRAGGWISPDNRTDYDKTWFPTDQIFAFLGVRRVNDTESDGELLNGTALQVGFLSHYTADTLPSGVSAYLEFTYIRYFKAQWPRDDPSRHYGGFIFRPGASYGPVQFGANITADPGFGFSAMLELGLRGGVTLRPGA